MDQKHTFENSKAAAKEIWGILREVSTQQKASEALLNRLIQNQEAEEVRRKKEEVAWRKELADEEAAWRKELADEEAAWRKELAAKEARDKNELRALKKKWATEEALRKKEEARGKNELRALKKKWATEEALRKKEEAVWKKKFAAEEAAWKKKFADEEAAWKKKFADEEARYKKEEAVRKKEADLRGKVFDRRMRELQELFTGQWGKLIESLVEGDLVNLLKEKGIDVEATTSHIKGEYQGERGEVDIVAINGHEVVVVEVKTSLKVKDVRYFLKKLSIFRKWRTEYRDKKIYGAVAYLKAYQSSEVLAEKEGLFVIRATGSSASIINKKHFKPKHFS